MTQNKILFDFIEYASLRHTLPRHFTIASLRQKWKNSEEQQRRILEQDSETIFHFFWQSDAFLKK